MDDLRVWFVLGLLTAVVLWAAAWEERRREGDRRERMHAREQGTARAVAPWAPANVPATYSPHIQYQYQVAGGAAPAGALPAPVVEAGPALPGVLDLGALLAGGWRPSAASILLGLGPGGAPITVGMGDHLCHVAFAGRTGSGKSNLMRLVLAQLCAAGAQVYLLDPHFTPTNPETGDDWRAIARRLAPGRAITDKREIVATVAGICTEIDRRLARWHAGADPGPARFYAIEELPLLVDYDHEFMDKLGRVLREGRKLRLFVIIAAQDMLVSTLGGSSGLRAQFATVYYGGGDPYTARALLAQKVPEPAGKGVVWMRSVTQPAPQQVRVPLVTNDNLTTLLGAGPVVDVVAREVPAAADAPPRDYSAPVATGATTAPGPELDPKVAAALSRFDAGATLPEAIEAAFGVSRKTPGAYGPAYDQVQRALRTRRAA